MKNMEKWCALALSFIVATGGIVACGQAENVKEQKQAAITDMKEDKTDKDIFPVSDAETGKEDMQEETVQKTTTEKKLSEEKQAASISKKEEKKSTSSSEKSSSQKKPSNNQSTSNTDSVKPEKKPSTSSKPNGTSKPNKPSKPSNDGNSVKPQKPSHTHKWVAVTKEVYHEATGHYEKVLVKKAWTEKIPIYETVCLSICNTCGEDITGNVREHIKKHTLAGEGGSHRTEYKEKQTGTKTVEHPAEYKDKWVEDSKAWTETVTTGYKCSCGAKK